MPTLSQKKNQLMRGIQSSHPVHKTGDGKTPQKGDHQGNDCINMEEGIYELMQHHQSEERPYLRSISQALTNYQQEDWNHKGNS